MNRKILLMFLLLSAVMGIQAQERKVQWSVIPRIGINSSTISNKDESINYIMGGGRTYFPTTHKVGLTAGVDVDFQYSKRLSSSLGLSYSNEGYRLKYIQDSPNISFEYIGLNLMENVYIVRGLALKTGVQIGYLNDAFGDYGENKWNVSIPVGVSYEYSKFIVDLRYLSGLSDVGGLKWNKKKCKTSSLWLTLGYRIGL